MSTLFNRIKSKVQKKGVFGSLFTVFIASFLFYADAAMADQASDQARGVIESIISMPINYQGTNPELAHKYFSDIFGSFIFLPWGTGQADQITLLARAVGFTNILSLFLGLVIIFYVMIGGALQTAHQGEVLGKSWSSVWIPMRAALGFGLIMPAAGIGGGVISVAQIFIIWLIVMGSNAATVLWGKTIDNIGSGTPIAAPIYSTGVTPSREILKMLACTDSYIRGRTVNKKGASASDITVLEITSGSGKKMVLNSERFDESVSAFRSRASGLGSFITGNEAKTIKFANGGACGQIDIENDGMYSTSYLKFGEDEVFLSKQKKAAVKAARAVIASTIDSLSPVAMSLRSETVNAIGIEQAIADGDTDNEMYKTYNSAISSFGPVSNRYANDLVSKIHGELSGKSVAQDWTNKMKKGGWIKAGTWFHEIGNYTGESLKAITAINGSINSASPVVCVTSYTDQEGCNLKNADLAASVRIAEKIAAGYITAISNGGANSSMITMEDKAASMCTDASTCSIGKDTFTSAHRGIATTVLNLLAESSYSNNPVTDTSGLSNPFETVTSIGHSMNNAAIATWSTGALIASIKGAAEAANDGLAAKVVGAFTLGSTNGFVGALTGLGGYLLTSLIGLAVMLASTGFVLAYMLPMLPVVTWINMVAGYLLTVVEATIAAPLAIIMMVTPEGEGISGTRLERAMQLLAMAILKPSLMIIGLVASITLSYVSFGMLNNFFFESAGASLTGNILDFVAIIIIYATTALTLCKLNITIMYKLSDQILDWFSSGVGRQFGESESSGGMEQSIQNMKSGASSVSQSITARISEKRRMDMQHKLSQQRKAEESAQ
ncbi:DotA/TraY family protein [Aeromonas sp. MrichA-1]|uniref:DotA/TraY family protein n=1 Tax=Aeromonas sp. MrichA-1 TaxID=2823362 RepID=UPI001B33C37F|nr:DotA/TraY family protein [Aeromonas sp. MrichA-1]MBP4081431.1 DotA/TraY family protein [Aeromonas sp. MrichA-1]